MRLKIQDYKATFSGTYKTRILLPKPNSQFQKIQCTECKEESVVYSHVSTVVKCPSCGNVLAEPTGSFSKVFGKIMGTVD